MTTANAINLENLMTDEELQSADILSVAPAVVPENHTVIEWSRRSTEKNPVAADQRYRGIIIHAAQLRIPDGATTSKFQKLLQDTIYDLAASKFQNYIKDAMHVRSMPVSMLSLDNVMAYWAEEKQRQQVNAEQIIAFLKQSATLPTLTPQAAKVWLDRIPKIAAPSYSNLFTKGEAAAIVSKIVDADLEHTTAEFIVTRCNAIINKVSMEGAF